MLLYFFMHESKQTINSRWDRLTQKYDWLIKHKTQHISLFLFLFVFFSPFILIYKHVKLLHVGVHCADTDPAERRQPLIHHNAQYI